jgi:serine/threonine-protein kinase
MAQGLLGGLLLEAGAITNAITHLEAAFAIDPTGIHGTDLARAYIYVGRFDEGMALLRQMPSNPFLEYVIGRLELWRDRRYQMRQNELSSVPDVLRRMMAVASKTYATGVVTDEAVREYQWIAANIPERLRAAECQFIAEAFAYAGRHDDALAMIRTSVDAGCNDIVWFERCPLLQPLRSRPEFSPLLETARQRGEAILKAVRDAVS